jgi:hypothetical protein
MVDKSSATSDVDLVMSIVYILRKIISVSDKRAIIRRVSMAQGLSSEWNQYITDEKVQ